MSWDFSMTVNLTPEREHELHAISQMLRPYGMVGSLCELDYAANYTYNVASMFAKAIDGGIRSLNGRTGQECEELLEVAIERFESNPEVYAEMNPPNGWGDSIGAVNLLNELLGWCREAPLATMVVS